MAGKCPPYSLSDLMQKFFIKAQILVYTIYDQRRSGSKRKYAHCCKSDTTGQNRKEKSGQQTVYLLLSVIRYTFNPAISGFHCNSSVLRVFLSLVSDV